VHIHLCACCENWQPGYKANVNQEKSFQDGIEKSSNQSDHTLLTSKPKKERKITSILFWECAK